MLVITEWIPPAGLRWLNDKQIPHLYDPLLHQDLEPLRHALQNATGLVVRNRTLVTKELLDKAPKLRAVGRLGVGLDNIDLAACHAKGVAVVVPKGANAPSVVEYVTAALLGHYRPWNPWFQASLYSGWDRQAGGGEIYDKTVGIVGYGDIGHRVAEALTALGAHIMVFDPHLGPFDRAIMQHRVCRSDTLEYLLEHSDVVTLHAPLNSSTFHMLNDPMLTRMQEDAVLVNTARGQLIDETALVAHVERGRLARVILDVRAKEPPEEPDSLARYTDRVWLTPHIAGLSEPAQARVVKGVLRELTNYLV